MGHAHCKALVEAAVLTFVSVFLLDLAVAFALVVFQFESNGSPEEALWKIRKRQLKMQTENDLKKSPHVGPTL